MTKDSSETMQKARSFFQTEAKELAEVLTNENDLAPQLLRFHLLSEYMLDRIIASNLKRGDRILEDGNLTFNQKLLLVHSFDVVPDTAIASLRQLNRLRNALSHQRNAKITMADIDAVGRPFGSAYSEIRLKNKDDLKELSYETYRLSWFELALALAADEISN